MRRGKWNRGQTQTAQMVRGGFCVARARGAGSLISGDEGRWKMSISVRGTTDRHRPHWPGKIESLCMSYLKTGGPGKQRGTHKLPLEEFGKGQKERRDTSPYVLPTSPNPSGWSPSWLSGAHATRKTPVSE